MTSRTNSQTSLPDQLPINASSSTTSRTRTTSIESKQKLTRSRIPLKKEKKTIHLNQSGAVVKPRYFTAGIGINESNKKDLSMKPSPFLYPKNLDEFAHSVMIKAWRHNIHIDQLHSKCANKPSHKNRQKRDLLNRLYVEEPQVDDYMKTILDIAPEYFKIVEGRPITDRLDIRQYIDTVRDSLRTKILNGFREDDIMLIEENLLLEQKIIDSIRENYNQYVSIFEEFLYRDHTNSMQCLKDSETKTMEAFEKYEEYKSIAKKYNAARSSLYNSEEKWKNCLMYQKFLYLVSPFSWKVQKLNQSIDTLKENETDDESLDKYKLSISDQELSISDLLDYFKHDCSVMETPELYFTHPEQLIDVFRFMEMQNLNSLLYAEELANPLEQIKQDMEMAEQAFDKEIKNLQEIVDKLEGGISWAEDRAIHLEQLATNLIDGEFKNLIVDDEILNLHVFVEEVYETRIGPNDANLNMVDMMKAIEVKYRQELLSLDKVPAEQVAILEESAYAEQMMIMKLAETAAKQYAELEVISQKLNKAIEPPPPRRTVRELKYRSPPIEHRKVITIKSRDLTEDEMEYLEYFTDFCKYTDNPQDYGINPVKQMINKHN